MKETKQINVLVLGVIKGVENFPATYKILVSADTQQLRNSVHAIIVRSQIVDIRLYPNLRIIVRAGEGTDNIDKKHATEAGVHILNTPGLNNNAVCELVFTAIGSYARNLDAASRYLKQLSDSDSLYSSDEEFEKTIEAGKSQFTGSELANFTLGVFGLGKIGVLVANAGITRGMQVIGYDKFPNELNWDKLNSKVRIVNYTDQLLPEVDILSVHIPKQDMPAIDLFELNQLKQNCILVNYSRKGVYNDNSVLNFLNAKKIGAYLTDFPTKTLLRHPKVFCTPHLGASTNDAQDACGVDARKLVVNYFENGALKNLVNPDSVPSTVSNITN